MQLAYIQASGGASNRQSLRPCPQEHLGYGASELAPVSIAEQKREAPQPALPPWNGIGSPEDSLQNCLKLVGGCWVGLGVTVARQRLACTGVCPIAEEKHVRPCSTAGAGAQTPHEGPVPLAAAGERQVWFVGGARGWAGCEQRGEPDHHIPTNHLRSNLDSLRRPTFVALTCACLPQDNVVLRYEAVLEPTEGKQLIKIDTTRRWAEGNPGGWPVCSCLPCILLHPHACRKTNACCPAGL